MNMFRDLTLVPAGEDELLVIACDSLGGIGPKPQDTVKTSAEVVGRYIVRVPLMEVLAAGATPFVVVNTLSVEMEPTGKEILAGIRQEIMESGLATELVVTGSTEENVPTVQTALGVTVIGKTHKNLLKLGKARAGDVVACIGSPKVGDEVLDGTPVTDILLLRRLLKLPWAREILPVGSKGVLYEANQLAAGANTILELNAHSALDLVKSAGPATCLLVSLDEGKLNLLNMVTPLPVHRVGRLKKLE
jgi:hypothetical protein